MSALAVVEAFPPSAEAPVNGSSAKSPRGLASPAAKGPRTAADPVTVVIAETETLTRVGLRSILENPQDIAVVGEAADGNAAFELTLRLRPGVLIVDAQIGPAGGLKVAAAVRAKARETQVVMLSSHFADEVIFRALSVGASGLLLKDCAPQELVGGIRAVAAGRAVLAPCVARRLVNVFVGVDVDRAQRAQDLVESLSDREREVLAHMAEGMGNLEIARVLYMSEGAVKAHISRLLAKLGCANRVKAVSIYRDSRMPH
jgi:DNA-binding NarL/FixJ family response regulator